MSDISEIRAHPRRGEHYFPTFVGNAVITHVEMPDLDSDESTPTVLPSDDITINTN